MPYFPFLLFKCGSMGNVLTYEPKVEFGKEIGEKLANDLGIAFYDKELINLASEESGLCREFFEKADEKASQTLLGGLFGTRFPFITEGAYPYNSYLSNDSLF